MWIGSGTRKGVCVAVSPPEGSGLLYTKIETFGFKSKSNLQFSEKLKSEVERAVQGLKIKKNKK